MGRLVPESTGRNETAARCPNLPTSPSLSVSLSLCLSLSLIRSSVFSRARETDGRDGEIRECVRISTRDVYCLRSGLRVERDFPVGKGGGGGIFCVEIACFFGRDPRREAEKEKEKEREGERADRQERERERREGEKERRREATTDIVVESVECEARGR